MSLVALIIFNGLLASAAVSDLRSFRIPNVIPLALLAGLVLHLPADFAEALGRLGAVALVGLVGGWLWLRGLLGGGDYKLIWVCAAWTGLSGLPTFLLPLGVASGVQGLAMLLWTRDPALADAPWRARLRARAPLAVSIAAAGLVWSALQRMG